MLRRQFTQYINHCAYTPGIIVARPPPPNCLLPIPIALYRLLCSVQIIVISSNLLQFINCNVMFCRCYIAHNYRYIIILYLQCCTNVWERLVQNQLRTTIMYCTFLHQNYRISTMYHIRSATASQQFTSSHCNDNTML